MRSVRFFTVLVLALQLGAVAPSFADDVEHYAPRKRAPAKVVDLLAYMKSHVITEPMDEVEKRIPKYNRLQHFGRWVDVDSDCQTTMTEVLIRDSDPSEPLEFRDAQQCALVKGLWNDPYTGTAFRVKTALQIDHVVALKHAYVSGAHAWDQPRRCTYSNYMGNDFHLLAVSGHENMSKGAQGPDTYLPPNEAFHCEYVGIWMRIKAIWKLDTTPDEVAMLESVLKTKRCSKETYTMKEAALENERKATNNVPSVCARAAEATPSDTL
ncbi:MAG: HNH endonuclease family protein [Bdellovibrionota bacterium]